MKQLVRTRIPAAVAARNALSPTKLFAVAAAAAALCVAAGDARADHPRVDPGVREIVSSEVNGQIYRAIVYERRRGVALAVEIIDPRRRGGHLTHQERVRSYYTGGDRHRLRARSIELRGFRGPELRFSARTRDGAVLRCEYNPTHRRAGPQCRVRGDARPSPPPDRPGRPPRTRPGRDWSEVSQVKNACDRAVSGSRNRSACLDAASGARFDPTSLIRACDRAVSGSRNTISCVQAGAGASWDSHAVVAACDRAVSGSSNTLQCVDSAVKSRHEASAAVRACDRAVSGSSNVLRCVQAISGARAEMSSAVAACDRAVSGSSNTLQCVEYATRARRNPARIISRCDSRERGTRNTLACIERGVSGRR